MTTAAYPRDSRGKAAGAFCFLFALLLALFFLQAPSEASWFIDETRFHVSAHGQIACQDCHEEVAGLELHPDPGNVSRTIGHFFKAESCFNCHEEVEEELEQGRHGKKRVDPMKNYDHCLECHDPHTQPGPGEDLKGRFDRERPVQWQCGSCHEPQTALPSLSEEDEACMSCHRLSGEGEQEKVDGFCFHCHGSGGSRAQAMTSAKVPPINRANYRKEPHATLGCLACHPDASRFRHGDQKRTACVLCHTRHDEKVAHDAHLRVACEACHLEGVEAFSDSKSTRVLWKRRDTGADGHRLVLNEDEKSCRRCHVPGNRIGASAMLLPAKGILCMPCHASTFTLFETTTVAALIIFLAGLAGIFAYTLSGSVSPGRDMTGLRRVFALLRKGARSVFSGPVAGAVILDVLLQRRLFRQSISRWFIHSLIFIPFLFRFLWGLAGLLGSLWTPASPLVWSLLDKNHPVNAFLFDLTGVMMILGVLLAFIRGRRARSLQPFVLPRQDLFALALIAGIVLIGFLLEGLRISMTGYPSGSAYAPVGYGLGILFSGWNEISDIYGYVWYAHAVITCVFVAYLPFSRLIHIIMSPIVLILNARSGHE